MAAFGDSLMWGQGLRREDRFAWLVAEALAAAAGMSLAMVADRSRSGAQINANLAERQQFIDTFIEQFVDRAARRRFRAGDESAAENLYGEIPASFPTVSWQVDALAATAGRRIEVALVSGGANDIGFDAVLDPRQFPGAFIEEFDGRIRAIAHDAVFGLLAKVRDKCPSAVILQFGYHRPISYGSPKSRIEAYFKHELNDDFGWYLNKFLGVVPIDQMVTETRIRSEWAAGRAQHWMRQAVADANADNTIRGPGIVFVPAPFDEEHSAFGQQPRVWDDYTHKTTDPAQAERERRCPRAEHRGTLAKAARLLQGRLLAGGFIGTPFPRDELTALRGTLTGPGPVLDAIDAWLADPTVRATRNLDTVLRDELSRIQRALIASFVHPNTAGARAFADRAIARYAAHTELAAIIRRNERPGGADATSPVAEMGESVGDMLARFGLRGGGPLLADIGHLNVDALSLTVVTERRSDAQLAADVTLVIDRGPLPDREYRLNFPYRLIFAAGGLSGPTTRNQVKKFYPHFEPAMTNRFTIMVPGDLRLSDIRGVKVQMGPDPFAGGLGNRLGTVWRPRRIMLEINGRTVHDVTFRDRAIGPGEELALNYPPPAPQFTEPVVDAVV